MSKLIQKGNAKLHNMQMFNIPASREVCGRTCPGCYAIREQVRFPAVLTARTNRLEEANHPNFDVHVSEELHKLRNKPKFFRIHASGEFFSQDYIDAWERIVIANPDITFYTYTKRKQHFNFATIVSHQNFVLVDSLQFGGLNYGKVEDAPKGAFICPSHEGATCGESCTYCMTKEAQQKGVFFPKH